MVITVKVIPRSRVSSVAVLSDSRLRVALKSSPEKGKANDELIKVLARHYEVKRTHLKLISGHKGRTKRVKILKAE